MPVQSITALQYCTVVEQHPYAQSWSFCLPVISKAQLCWLCKATLALPLLHHYITLMHVMNHKESDREAGEGKESQLENSLATLCGIIVAFALVNLPRFS